MSSSRSRGGRDFILTVRTDAHRASREPDSSRQTSICSRSPAVLFPVLSIVNKISDSRAGRDLHLRGDRDILINGGLTHFRHRTGHTIVSKLKAAHSMGDVNAID